MIRAYLTTEQEEWDLYFSRAYRATANESTKMSQNLQSLGREIRLPADLVYGHQPNTSPTDVPPFCDWVEGLRYRMLQAHEVARRYLHLSAKRSKVLYNARVVQHNYLKGDLVWCLHETKKVAVCPKLEKRYDGPLVIKQKISELNFEIQMDREGFTKVIHHNKLKRYEGETPPKGGQLCLETRKKTLIVREVI
ncbi:uncharacterized protein LOC128558864 [Mercenaria mercenaria]|uniref:uncharacterized protein LOC128558864 n=1 Tax=Mercenaria mercenaria TaxID=6596 RepID=UPI00234EF56A|nr:uncharacterized protein LOC128558864 [Mercenaria mercenaria]